MGGSLRRLPGDPVVLPPVGDLALPLAPAEPDLLLPLEMLIVLLLDAQHSVHELRELLELRPLLIGLCTGTATSVQRWIGSRRVFSRPPLRPPIALPATAPRTPPLLLSLDAAPSPIFAASSLPLSSSRGRTWSRNRSGPLRA